LASASLSPEGKDSEENREQQAFSQRHYRRRGGPIAFRHSSAHRKSRRRALAASLLARHGALAWAQCLNHGKFGDILLISLIFQMT
jgi:hypothetical protein